MSNRLDFLLFGNGYGMAAPYFSQPFYWLVDENTGKGCMYTWIGGFGAQLKSFEWFMPKPGVERRIKGRVYRPFNARRKWLRVDISWATNLPCDIDAKNAEIRQIKADLSDYGARGR